MTDRADLWSRLVAANLVAGPMPETAAEASPWYVTAMIGIAAWVASLFFLVFVGIALAEVFRYDEGWLPVGLVLCAACAVAFRIGRRSMFVTQLALSMSLAGQALIAYGVLRHQTSNPAAWIALAVIAIVLVAAAPHSVHRVLAALAAALCTRYALAFAGLSPMFPALVAAAFLLALFGEERGLATRALWHAVATGLALGALVVIPAQLGEIFWWGMGTHRPPPAAMSWAGAFALAVVFLAAIARALHRARLPWSSRTSVVALAAGAALALAARPVAGLTLALIILLAAFGAGRRALAGLAIAGMLFALGHYYHSMDTTLLAKSAALFASGVVLLAAGLAVRLGIAGEEADHA